jgi:hypothetical protein
MPDTDDAEVRAIPTPDTDNAKVRGILILRSAVQGERDADTKREVMPIRGEKGC